MSKVVFLDDRPSNVWCFLCAGKVQGNVTLTVNEGDPPVPCCSTHVIQALKAFGLPEGLYRQAFLEHCERKDELAFQQIRAAYAAAVERVSLK